MSAETILERVFGARTLDEIQRRLRRPWSEQPCCPRCGRHRDRDLPQADRCHCHTTTTTNPARTP